MKYLKFTYVDAITGIPVTDAPAENGPKFPDVEGLEFAFALESQYPTSAPTFFGTCPDNSVTMVPGVIDALTEADFLQAKNGEIDVRKSILRASINAKRDVLETQGFPHAGLWFQSDERSVARLNSTALTAQAALMAGQPAAFPDWLAADNTPLPVDAAGMLALQASLTQHAGALHQHSRSLKLLVEAAETVADLKMIDINAGWPGENLA